MAGSDGRVLRVYTIDNRLTSPSAYEMDPQQQLEAMLDIEERGWDLLAIFHSHPSGPDVPSTVDLSTAYYPEVVYVIVSFINPEQPSAKAFTIGEGRVEEIPLIVD
jgi:proteasome lid subunit RPN8/RPN11